MTTQFDDGKDAGALRTIGEVSDALGIKTHVLRYWEQQFPTLDPLKRSGGRRYYRPEDVALVQEIDRLVNREGYTLKGAALALEDRGPVSNGSPSAAVQSASMGTPRGGNTPAASATLAATITRLKSIRQTLAEAIA